MFRLRPATVEVVQKMTRAEGATPGKFRVAETGEEFSEMHLVLLDKPNLRRTFYEKGAPFGAEALCYSIDSNIPGQRAKVPQAMSCEKCPRSDWTKWNKTHNREDLPLCRAYYSLPVVDRVTMLPYRFQVRGKSISEKKKATGLKVAMSNLARVAALMLAQNGVMPNLFDFSFKVNTVKVEDASGLYYVINFKDFAPIKEEDRAAFGNLYMRYVASRQQGADESELTGEEAVLNTEFTSEQGTGEAQPEVVI